MGRFAWVCIQFLPPSTLYITPPMSTPSKAGSMGLVMSGLTSATLVGVPSAAWLGPHWDWRAAFVFVGAIAALACLLLRRAVPDLPAAHGASPLRELAALARPRVY